jgi:glucose PTS system EIICB or EIICBA component
LYGFVERMLIPFGLHHIWNAPFFTEAGSFTDASGQIVHGDIHRFFAGDPTAGILSGAFFFKMFGLPAAAMAMWRAAKPENRVAVGGIMISAALTSFLTGITEPIEFSFLFVAPGLYFLHALLVASAQFVANTLDMHMGFTFSQGGIDFLLFNVLGKFAHNWVFTLIVGPIYALIYYVTFTVVIRWFDLKTPGREDATEAVVASSVQNQDSLFMLTQSLGGSSNIKSLDACITRLRVQVENVQLVDSNTLKKLGASGVMIVGTGVQAVFGPRSENLKTDLDIYLKSGNAPKTANLTHPSATAALTTTHVGNSVVIDIAKLQHALGGASNIKSAEAVAGNRLRIQTVQPVEFVALHNAGVDGVVEVSQLVYHLIVGPEAAAIAGKIK